MPGTIIQFIFLLIAHSAAGIYSSTLKYSKKFTYIIRKLMEYEDLDDVKSNVFDVKTSKAMAEVEKQVAKDSFINGIGKNGQELISLFEINAIVEEKEMN